ncbi:hypothetical protein D3C81_632550 [compost metagenome]
MDCVFGPGTVVEIQDCAASDVRGCHVRVKKRGADNAQRAVIDTECNGRSWQSNPCMVGDHGACIAGRAEGKHGVRFKAEEACQSELGAGSSRNRRRCCRFDSEMVCQCDIGSATQFAIAAQCHITGEISRTVDLQHSVLDHGLCAHRSHHRQPQREQAGIGQQRRTRGQTHRFRGTAAMCRCQFGNHLAQAEGAIENDAVDVIHGGLLEVAQTNKPAATGVAATEMLNGSAGPSPVLRVLRECLMASGSYGR